MPASFTLEVTSILIRTFGPSATLGEAAMLAMVSTLHDHGVAATPTQLADKLGLPLSSVSRWIQHRCDERMLIIVPDANDERKKRVHLHPSIVSQRVKRQEAMRNLMDSLGHHLVPMVPRCSTRNPLKDGVDDGV